VANKGERALTTISKEHFFGFVGMAAPRNAVSKLRALAVQKGFEVERAMSADRWRLVDPKGNRPNGPRGVPSWRFDEAMKFLRKLPDV
jgi:hypothetical protein